MNAHHNQPGVIVRWECEFCGREGKRDLDALEPPAYKCYATLLHPTKPMRLERLDKVVQARQVGRCKPVRYVREDPA